MALALIVLQFLSLLILVSASFGGIAAAHGMFGLEIHTRAHVMLALFAAIMVLFTHCMTMFYFIGTGIRMRELVEEHKVIEEDLLTPTKRFKGRVFPFATMALLFTMVTFIIGGGVDKGRVDSWIHLSVAIAAIILNLIAVRWEVICINANVRLFDHLDDLLEAREK